MEIWVFFYPVWSVIPKLVKITPLCFESVCTMLKYLLNLIFEDYVLFLGIKYERMQNIIVYQVKLISKIDQKETIRFTFDTSPVAYGYKKKLEIFLSQPENIHKEYEDL